MSQEGKEGKEGWRHLILVKKVKSWSSRRGGRGLGCVERNEHLKQLGWTGWEGGLLGKSEEELTACLPRNKAPPSTRTKKYPFQL